MGKTRVLRTCSWGLLLCFAVAVLAYWLLVDTIPPKNLTETRMSIAGVRLMKHASAQHALPSTLSELPPEPNRDSEIIDGWGRPILYAFDSSSLVTLTSLGRDGKPGGTGEDTDIIRQFMAQKPDGTWVDDHLSWLDPRHSSSRPSTSSSPSPQPPTQRSR